MNFQDKYKDKMTSEPVKVKTSSFGNLDRFFCHLKKVFITENSRENKYIYKTCGLKTGSIKEEWAADSMSDALVDGRRIRTFNIIDHFNRFVKGIKIGTNLPARVIIDYLEQRIDLYRKPKRIRTDNGPEFRSKLFQKWLRNNGIEWSRIQKGKPQQNAIIERFNKTYREDVLDANIFRTVEQAIEITQIWLNEYNHGRPHQSLNYQTPVNYAA